MEPLLELFERGEGEAGGDDVGAAVVAHVDLPGGVGAVGHGIGVDVGGRAEEEKKESLL